MEKLSQREKNIKMIKRMIENNEEDISFEGANIIVTGQDDFMSGWGCAEGTKAYSIVLCENKAQAFTAIEKMRNDGFKYLNYRYLSHNITLNKDYIYTLRHIKNCRIWQ